MGALWRRFDAPFDNRNVPWRRATSAHARIPAAASGQLAAPRYGGRYRAEGTDSHAVPDSGAYPYVIDLGTRAPPSDERDRHVACYAHAINDIGHGPRDEAARAAAPRLTGRLRPVRLPGTSPGETEYAEQTRTEQQTGRG